MCALCVVIGCMNFVAVDAWIYSDMYRIDSRCNCEEEYCIVAMNTSQLTWQRYYCARPAIVSVFISPSGGLLAYGSAHDDETDDSLNLFDMKRKESLLIEQRVATRENINPWSPDGKTIAYMTCRNPGGTPVGTGVWLYDVAAGTKEKIRDSGARIAWASTGKRLYVLDREKGVLTYDVSTKCWGESTLMDVFISPNGRYYAVFEADLVGVCLFATADNEPLWQELLSICPNGTGPHWCGSRFYVLDNLNGYAGQGILDCEKGVIYQAPGNVIEILDGDTNVVYWKHEEKTLSKKAIRDLEIIAPQKKVNAKMQGETKPKPVVSAHEQVTQYSDCLDSLDKSDPRSVPRATEAYVQDIVPLDRASRDEGFLAFLDFYNKVCFAVCHKLEEEFGSTYEKLTQEEKRDLDWDKLFCPADCEKRLQENGMLPVPNFESGSWVAQEPDYALSRFGAYISPVLRTYLELRKPELKEAWCGDAEIGISRQELAARVRKWEKYAEDYPNSPLAKDAHELFRSYFPSFLGGQDNSPVFQTTAVVSGDKAVWSVSAEDMVLFEKYATENAKSFSGCKVRELLALIKRSNNAFSSEGWSEIMSCIDKMQNEARTRFPGYGSVSGPHFGQNRVSRSEEQ